MRRCRYFSTLRARGSAVCLLDDRHPGLPGGTGPTVRNLAGMRTREPARMALSALLAVVLLATGCARFNDAASAPFTTEPKHATPPSSTPATPPPLPDNPFPKECPAPGVMQGCLNSTSGLIMGPDSKSALVAERTTGAVKQVAVNAEPKVKGVIPVDTSCAGGV